MTDQYTVFLIGGGRRGDDEQAVFTLHDAGTKCRLTCNYRDKVIEAEEDDEKRRYANSLELTYDCR